MKLKNTYRVRPSTSSTFQLPDNADPSKSLAMAQSDCVSATCMGDKDWVLLAVN